MNMVVPIGWLPLSVMAAAEGSFLPTILGFLGMTTIGVISLYRAYRTTVGMYQGQQSSGKGRPLPAVTAPAEKREASAELGGIESAAGLRAGCRRRARRTEIAPARTRGQDDVAQPDHHECHLRQHALAVARVSPIRFARSSPSAGWCSSSSASFS